MNFLHVFRDYFLVFTVAFFKCFDDICGSASGFVLIELFLRLQIGHFNFKRDDTFRQIRFISSGD